VNFPEHPVDSKIFIVFEVYLFFGFLELPRVANLISMSDLRFYCCVERFIDYDLVQFRFPGSPCECVAGE